MRRALIAAGALLTGYAVSGALRDSEVDQVGVAIFLAAVVVAHDGMFLPAVLAAGALVSRRRAPRHAPADPPLESRQSRASARAAVQVAGVISLPVLVVGLPLVLGPGSPPDNASALPLPYGRNLLLILGSIWVAALLPGAVRAVRKRLERSRAGTPRRRSE
jgi:hypothetical protein